MKICPRSPSALRLRRWIGIALASLLSMAAQAQNAIEAVTSTARADVELVRIDFTHPLAALPTGFVVQEPARIALDFPGVANAVGRSAIEFNLGNLRSANVVQAGERSRVVLNLKHATTYQAEIQGRSLLVSLQSGTGQPPRTSSTAGFAEGRERQVTPLQDIDFRRGGDGAGRVLIAMGSSQLGVDVRRQGSTLVAEFMQASLPEALRRRLDVSDFGTAVESVVAQQVGDRVRLTINSRGDWEQSAYQTDEQFVIEVRPRKTDPGKLTQGTGYTGEKLTLNFQSVDVRALLQVIADFTGFNVVTSDTVSGVLTLRLKDVPWDQALEVILQAKNLGLRKNGSILWIAPRDEINAKEKIELEALAALENLAALRTQSFQLNYAKAATVVQSLTGTGSAGGSGGASATRLLSTRGSAIAEVRTNQLFVTDTPQRLAEVSELIRKLDVPVRQVLIEARIVEASDTFGKSLGVKLGGGAIGKNSSFGTSPTGSDNSFTSYTSSNFVNLPAGDAGGTGSSAGAFSLSLFNSSFTRMLNLEISALEAEGKGRLVSSPRVVTADQTKALIEQGEEIPYQQATSSGATSISFRKAVLKLEVTPQITPEGNIILTLDVSKDTRGVSTSAGPAINTKHVQTEVLVENGGTVVIGGIFELTETNDESRVPVLGEVPYLGALFRSRERVVNKVEMLVFITPKMIARQNAAL
ncbi:type IV pilus secretin family protein [Variovorax paradoxus]|uniref:Type IV pilus biogenesis and competence protein PilQ n=1 Tax=Variovorax paradoxus TaxID=34073 RepID=A0A0H2M0Q9_VARPD|nr:type IV pilus secretin family protein [Variovorax paradoxus]KLN54317.1 type IV pilus biogenesis and competence protein PilQ precursor [Variovorax paradoxus]